MSTTTGGAGGGALAVGDSDGDIYEIRIFNFWLTDNVITDVSSEMLSRESARLCARVLSAVFVAGVAPWGYYTSPELYYTGGVWMDVSGNNNSAVGTNGAMPTIAAGGLHFASTQSMVWPAGSVPSSFTIFVRARYTPGGTKQTRIFQGTTVNWFLGWWSGNENVAYFNTWMTAQTSSASSFSWMVIAGRNSATGTTVWVNGSPMSTASGGSGGTVLAVNTGTATTEASDCDVSEVRIFDQASKAAVAACWLC